MEDVLGFNRNKFIGIEKIDDNTIRVFGTLEDNLYAHEIEFEFDLNELKILKIKGHMRRFTTPLCPPAAELLQKAVGMKLEPGITSKIKREISRPGCRHFGNLLNECLNSIIPAILSNEWRKVKEENPEMTRTEFFKYISEKIPIVSDYCAIFSEKSPIKSNPSE
ncbi:MAG: DUF2889 domain-containing protein [Candidatus Helarchaeota archaeon]